MLSTMLPAMDIVDGFLTRPDIDAAISRARVVDGTIVSPLLARVARANVERLRAWQDLWSAMIESERLIDTITAGADLPFEDESDADRGRWLTDEHGIAYFEPFAN